MILKILKNYVIKVLEKTPKNDCGIKHMLLWEFYVWNALWKLKNVEFTRISILQ